MPALWLIVGAAGAETVDEQVARGWYLWRTGQDAPAAEVARAAFAADPTNLAAVDLYSAMEVVAGNGFSVESAAREAWGQAPDDPVRRVAVAAAVTYRHAEKGNWCDEVIGLLAPVVDGDPHYWATVVDRQRERRCTGDTGHADAELRRLAKDPAGRGWADGVLAKLDAGYIKEELPDELEKLWTQQPYRLDAAGWLWRDSVAGPGKAAARRVARKAMDGALAGSDPVAVHATLLAAATAQQDKDKAAAAARLAMLDPAARTDLVRSVDDVADSPVYAKIDACATGFDLPKQIACLDALALPATGSIAAYGHYVRRLLYDGVHDADQVYAEAKAAWEADKAHRFDARTFARLAAERKVDLALALEAADVALAGRVPVGAAPGALPAALLKTDPYTATLRKDLARDLELRVDLLVQLGRAAEAIDLVRLAQAIEPTPARQLLVGMVLAQAGRGDEAAVALSYALTAPIDDTARVSAARDLLAKAGWLGSAQAMVDAAARDPKEAGPTPPLTGQKLTDATLLPTPPPADPKAKKPPPPGIRVIATWASWQPDSVLGLERLASIAKHYNEKSATVTVVALGIDAEDVKPALPPPPPPAPAPGASAPAPAPPAPALAIDGIEVRHAGPAAMRALKVVAVPSVVVVDAKGTVVAVVAPWDRNGLALETALDGLLPKP